MNNPSGWGTKRKWLNCAGLGNRIILRIAPAIAQIRGSAANPEDFIFLGISSVILCFGLEAERLLRTPVVGRKNYYGSRAQWSGELAAMLWTLWATAAQNGQPLDAEAVTWFLPWALREADRTAWSRESAS